jgi:hypothetical protein
MTYPLLSLGVGYRGHCRRLVCSLFFPADFETQRLSSKMPIFEQLRRRRTARTRAPLR